MALNWQWSDKIGECVYKDGTTANIYKGNAYMIVCSEWDDQYCVQWFAIDREHLKNMLGLNKNYTENDFQNLNIETLKLHTDCKIVPEIVQYIAKAKTKIKIELY